MTIVIVLSLFAASCSGDTIVAGGEERPTPVPAPTIPGEVIEVPVQEVAAQTVLIGVSADDTVDLHALPGLDQPLAGDITPGTPIEPLGNAFMTDDGLTWWQVRAGDLQGWIQPNIAYQGVSEDVTDRAIELTIADPFYPTSQVAINNISKAFAADEGAPEIVTVDLNETPGRGGTYTVDLLGFEDDSQIGYRLVITLREEVDSWTPISVLQYPLCSRGVSPNGLCS